MDAVKTPLLDIDRTAAAITALHPWLVQEGFLQLERYPWPGRLPSFYHDPAILVRYLSGMSNCWQTSAVSSAYYSRLARSRPELWTLCQAFMLCEPIETARLERRLTSERCRQLRDAGV